MHARKSDVGQALSLRPLRPPHTDTSPPLTFIKLLVPQAIETLLRGEPILVSALSSLYILEGWQELWGRRPPRSCRLLPHLRKTASAHMSVGTARRSACATSRGGTCLSEEYWASAGLCGAESPARAEARPTRGSIQ